MDRETDRLRKRDRQQTDETWTTGIERQTDRDGQMNRWTDIQTDG